MRISSRITALKYKCLYNSLLYINRNNAETKRYQEEGLKLLSGKDSMLFFMKSGTGSIFRIYRRSKSAEKSGKLQIWKKLKKMFLNML